MTDNTGETAPAVVDQQSKKVGHRWQPGESGNPAGRAPDKLHAIGLQRKLEIAIRGHIRPDRICKIIDKLCDLAEAGDVKAAKLLLDKTVANATLTDETPDETGQRVVFRIENATFAAAQKTAARAVVEGEIIEAEVVSADTAPSVPQDPVSTNG